MLKYKFINNKKDKNIVLIHGYLSLSSFWDQFLPEFNKHFNILLMDLPGHGENIDYQTTNTLHGFTKEIIKVIKDVFNDKPYIVGGHSLGGYITTEIISSRKNHATSAFIINAPNTPNITSKIKEYLAGKNETIQSASYKLISKAKNIELFKGMIIKLFQSFGVTFDIEKYNIERNETLIEILLDISDYHIENTLIKVTVPTLVLCCTKDISLSRLKFEKVADKNAYIFVKRIPNSPHWGFDDPKYVINTIMSFVK